MAILCCSVSLTNLLPVFLMHNYIQMLFSRHARTKARTHARACARSPARPPARSLTHSPLTQSLTIFSLGYSYLLVIFHCDLFQISLADLKVVGMSDPFRYYKVNADMDDYPKLKSLGDRVRSEPSIAAWIAKRPETAF